MTNTINFSVPDNRERIPSKIDLPGACPFDMWSLRTVYRELREQGVDVWTARRAIRTALLINGKFRSC